MVAFLPGRSLCVRILRLGGNAPCAPRLDCFGTFSSVAGFGRLDGSALNRRQSYAGCLSTCGGRLLNTPSRLTRQHALTAMQTRAALDTGAIPGELQAWAGAFWVRLLPCLALTSCTLQRKDLV